MVDKNAYAAKATTIKGKGITVIIRHQGQTGNLQKLFDSFLQYSRQTLVEFLVCTSYSKSIMALAEQYADRIFIRMIQSPHHSKAMTMNRLVSKAKYDFLLIIDDDVYFKGDFLSTVIKNINNGIQVKTGLEKKDHFSSIISGPYLFCPKKKAVFPDYGLIDTSLKELAVSFSEAGAAAVPPVPIPEKLHNTCYNPKIEQDLRRLKLFDDAYYVSQLTQPEPDESLYKHYLSQGSLRGLKPNAFFDPAWYKDRYAIDNNIDPLVHYFQKGWLNGCNPSPEFDAEWYFKTNPDVKKANCEPLNHYLRSGRKQKRRPRPLRILFVDGEPKGMSSFFRVYQTGNSLRELGFHVDIFNFSDTVLEADLIVYDIFVIFRSIRSELVEQVLFTAASAGRTIIFDCDDLLFLPGTDPASFDIYAHLHENRKPYFAKKLVDSHYILTRSSYFTSTTPFLTEAARPFVKKKESYIIKNYPPAALMNSPYRYKTERLDNDPPAFNIYYFSGTNSHQQDLMQVYGVLADLLSANKKIQLHIVGIVKLSEFPKLGAKIGSQVFLYPYIPSDTYFDKLSAYMYNADIVIAPQDCSKPYVHGKSEFKLVEAGIFGVPIVASPTHTFSRTIQNRVTGFICKTQDEWMKTINKLIQDKSLRQSISLNVRTYIHDQYSHERQLENIIDVYGAILDRDSYLRFLFRGKENVGSFIPSIVVNHAGPRELARPRNRFEVSQLPPIDVSVVTYYSFQWIEAFLQSLNEQDYPLDRIHLFLHDHSESDRELLKIEALLKSFRSVFGSVTLSGSKNEGYGSGHNKNADRATSDWFVVINCDLLIPHNSLKLLLQTALNDDDRTAVWEGRQKPFEHPKFYDPVSMRTAWVSGAYALFRKSVWKEVKGFDEHFFMYSEDVDISFRIRDCGYHLRYVPEAVVWHFSYDSSESKFKPLQAVGSFVGHFYIRNRFGDHKALQQSRPLFFKLARRLAKKVDLQSELVAKHRNWYHQNIEYFRKTRKTSDLMYPFWENSHEVVREGAFFHNQICAQNPLVSVIVRVHGPKASLLLQEALATLQNQTWKNLEAVVVEDRGNFNEAVCSQVKKNGLKITFLCNETGGRIRSANMGLQKARGDFLMFLDYDDLLMADHVETLANHLALNRDIGVVVSKSWSIITKYINDPLVPISYKETGYERFRTQLKTISHEDLLKLNLLPVQAAMFRRQLYDEFGGMDETLPGLEDWELWIRYSKQCQIALIDKMTSLFRLREFTFHNVDKAKRQDRARLIINTKYQIKS